MPKKIVAGQRYGRLTVIKYLGSYKEHGRWECRCDCGITTQVFATNLLAGQTHSCGCITRELLTNSNFRHGLSRTKLYNRWKCIKQRCYRPKDKSYMRYGGRGIKMCDEWRDNFQAFYDWAMANGYQEVFQIDRIDNDGDYTPDNCRWVTCRVNQNNRSNSKKRLETPNKKEQT